LEGGRGRNDLNLLEDETPNMPPMGEQRLLLGERSKIAGYRLHLKMYDQGQLMIKKLEKENN